jgi:glycosyltransferase involved in cell wall biosynthesis
MKKRILFLAPYPEGEAPSQRFRFEQYYSCLREAGFEVHFQSFWDQRAWQVLYRPGAWGAKVLGMLRGFVRRLTLLWRARRYDFVFVHREVAPIGPPFFEWWISKILNKRLVYDFDDAIWLPNTSQQNRIAAFLKWHSKVKHICRYAYKISVGNDYLAAFARQWNTNVVVIPTTIDTGYHRPDGQKKPDSSKPVVLGWTGTHSTLPYLQTIAPVLWKLAEAHPIKVRVICNVAPDFELPSLEFVPWSKEREIEDLQVIDIGLMPLIEDAWAKGKCGFKALQYMALEIPPVVSPVGVNTRIVAHGQRGFWAHSSAEWLHYLELLVKDAALRARFGVEGRRFVEQHYSVHAHQMSVVRLFA